MYTNLLNDSDIKALFEVTGAVSALEAAYSQKDEKDSFPLRTMARGTGVWLRTLSGVLESAGIMGSKQISASIKGKRASYLISLFDTESSELLCLMDAQSVTGFRTAATSALAIRNLHDGPINKVAVIGSGYEAKAHLRALSHLMVINRAVVYSPNPTSRQRFIDELCDLSIGITSENSAEEAITGADVVICAARSKDESPVLKGAWLNDGMTIVSVGSTLPEQREVDEDVIAKADFIVADMVEEVVDDTGDMLAARSAGIAFEHKVHSLHSVVSKEIKREHSSQVILYKSVGAAIQDLAVAIACYRKAKDANLGTMVSDMFTPVQK